MMFGLHLQAASLQKLEVGSTDPSKLLAILHKYSIHGLINKC
jgi:hypothetical protein